MPASCNGCRGIALNIRGEVAPGNPPSVARRTNAAQMYKQIGTVRAVQFPLGHTKMDSTVRSIGIELEDALESAEHIEI